MRETRGNLFQLGKDDGFRLWLIKTTPVIAGVDLQKERFELRTVN